MANNNMYRSSMLEKLSSPEQLDRLVVITSPSTWLAIAGGALIAAVVIIWSMVGWLPVKTQAGGVYLPAEKAGVSAAQTQNAPNVVRCYVPVSMGRRAEVGMTAMVYPSGISQQEYGHMEATVIAVDDSISTTESLMNTVENEALAASFLYNGPVVGVTCLLQPDASTASGYHWSSKKGAALTLMEGTPVTVDIVTQRRHPISLVLPLVQETVQPAVIAAMN